VNQPEQYSTPLFAFSVGILRVFIDSAKSTQRSRYLAARSEDFIAMWRKLLGRLGLAEKPSKIPCGKARVRTIEGSQG
jgi:hypothetical protein